MKTTPFEPVGFTIRFSRSFRLEFKRLRTKYPSLESDLQPLLDTLRLTPQVGDALGKDCYKVRLAIRSKGKGKSGGARVITLVLLRQQSVTLLTIYDKSERENLSASELAKLLAEGRSVQ